MGPVKYEKPELISFNVQSASEGAQCADGTADAVCNDGASAPQDCGAGGNAIWTCTKGTNVSCMIGHSF